MRRGVALVVAVLVGAVLPLRGQRAHQLELGAPASATRYDHLMGLPDHVGILVYLGYFLSRGFAIEVAGGFSQPQTPYDYGDHAVHAGIGDRIFLFPGAALRLEGRAIFAPQTDPRFGGRWAGHVVGSFGLSMFTGRRAKRSRSHTVVSVAARALVT